MRQLIGYIRVSTKQQGESGLGLEAQLAALNQYAQQVGGTILRTYREVESGRRKTRPELLKAIGHSKRSKATLVVAKLDRLARNVAFLSALMESGIDFVCCDNPHANKLTIHVLAAVAEAEADAISKRTKAALAAYKARGGRLGAHDPRCKKLTDAARQRGAAAGGRAVALLAKQDYADLVPTIVEWREAGWSQQAIADRLNDEGHTTRNGRPWNQVQVMRLLNRYT